MPAPGTERSSRRAWAELRPNFGELAQQDGLHPGRRLSWLTNCGHIHFAERSPDDLLVEALRKIYLELGRDEEALAAKRTGSDPTPDFLSVKLNRSSRSTRSSTYLRPLLTLRLYPGGAELGCRP
jgi:hypothetical protein